MNSELKEKEKIIDNSFEQYWNAIMDSVCSYLKLSDDDSLGLRCHVSEIEHDEFAKPIYDLVDRPSTPTGGIKTAEQLAMDWANKEGYEHPSPYYSFLEGWKAHNQFAGDGWSPYYAPMALGFFDNIFLYDNKHPIKNKVLQVIITQ